MIGYILAIIGITIVIIAAAIVVIRTNKASIKIDVSPNLPIGLNPCRTKFTSGYYSLLIKSQLPRKNKCTLIEGYPLDNEQGENKPQPLMQSFVVKNEFIRRFARGTLSSRREIVIFIGRSPADYPEEMRDTTEGKWMAKEGQLAFLESTFGKAISSGDEALAEAMRGYARGQVTKNTLQEMKEINRKFREMKLIEAEEKPEVKK